MAGNSPSEIITSPKGGGALQGIAEKFSPDLFTGTGNFTVPLALPPGRNGFKPELNLVYSTGNGNGPFGLGWSLSIPGVNRKTSKGIPRYPRYDDSRNTQDTFILSGAEDLVPVGNPIQGVSQYRPRTEGLFARILHHRTDAADDFWEVKSKDGLTSFYGTPGAAGTDPAVIADPAVQSQSRVFAWKLTLTTDPFGNRIEYSYARDAIQIDGPHHWDQLYLKEIRYADYDSAGSRQFLVKIKLTYDPRPDLFSDYRAGFEIRTILRCKQIDVFTYAGAEIPVRTYHLIYQDGELPLNRASLLSQIVVEGHDGNNSESLPPLEFGYTQFQPEARKFMALAGSLPANSLADKNLELVDLFGRGLPDILEMNGTVRYWRNTGQGQFALPHQMDEAPAGVGLADVGVQILDANGDGRADLLVTTQAISGYYPLKFGGLWDEHSFQRYRVAPSFDLKDPEVRLVDLDGDGVTDAIRSSTRLECYFNDPEQGWISNSRFERKTLDVFPDVDFADPRVKWADMTGDGLQDIVLVHDGLVEYWPSFGRGNWGKPIEMPGPRFPWGYDPKRILLGDVDGDGAADLVYVDDMKVTLWINQNGNGWSAPISIQGTPPVSDMDSVRLADLLGNGISGILWSKASNGLSRSNFFFLDFTGGVKPYLMNEMNNHMGSQTRVDYKPSTWYYLQDEQYPSTRWVTPLPFPVQVVARAETMDQFSGGKLTTEYSYHHGYWDGTEREFRGFGRVDRRDTQVFSDSNGVPSQYFTPQTETRTWFHQGAIGDRFDGWTESDSLSSGPEQKRFTDEYYLEPWPGDVPTAQVLSRPLSLISLLNGLPVSVRRDAFRSLRGNVLRTELYALDGSVRQNLPYTVTEHVYGVREESPPDSSNLQRLRVFFPLSLSERTTQWERGNDPLTVFTFTDNCDAHGSLLDYDTYGQLLSEIKIAVPRGRSFLLPTTADQPYLATHNISSYAQRDDAQVYIVDRPSGTTTFEVVNSGSASIFDLVKSIQSNSATQEIASRTVSFYDGGAFQPLSFGQIGNYGALVRTDTLVLTAGILQAVYGANVPPYFATSGAPIWTTDYPQEFRDLLPTLAGYTYHVGGSGSPYETGYYRSTDQRKYDFQDDPQGKGRGLLTGRRDPLGHDTTISLDSFALLPVTVTNSVSLTTQARYDYRVFQPSVLTDPNGNQTSYTFTPLGLLEKIFVAGKLGENVGDPTTAPSTQFTYTFIGTDSSGQPVPIADLGQPVSVLTVRRAHHATETDVPQPTRDQTIETVKFSDGFGRVLQTRAQAEDVIFDSVFPTSPVFGDAGLPTDQAQPAGDAVGQQALGGNSFVVVSGWQIYDNKGQVVEKYEPFFSVGWAYAQPSDSQQGQKAILYYDPRGHVIRTVNPDGSEQRVVYGVPGTIASPDLTNPDIFEPTPWEAYTYDANDNAGRTHPSSSTAYQQDWNTPSNIVIDALGRTVLTTERNKNKQADGSWSPIVQIRSTSSFDIRGNVLDVTDAMGRTAFTHAYDLANRPLAAQSIDAGVHLTVRDAANNIIEQRDSKEALILHGYDPQNRAIRVWARAASGQPVTLREKTVYGDDTVNSGLTPAQAVAANLLGQPYKHFDEAGLLTFAIYDFKGNVLDKTRNVITESALLAPFTAPRPNWIVTPFRVDWSSPNLSFLDTATSYETTLSYDALNRVKSLRYPQDLDGARKLFVPQYNRAGALENVQLNATTYIDRIAYNAKGQRILISYGNGLMTRYAYDPHTFRMLRMRTERYSTPLSAPFTYHPSVPATPFQELGYEYDLAGNILAIHDRTPGSGIQNTPLGADALDRSFVYDPIYRLISATGRECDVPPSPPPWIDSPRCMDSTKVCPYSETYQHDDAGNISLWKHTHVDASGNASTTIRQFAMMPGNISNQLSSLTIGSTTYPYKYDPSGNLIIENTERHFEWDQSDRLRVFRVQPDGAVPSIYGQYLYDSGGQRVMKLVRDQSGGYETTIYVDGVFEHQRNVSGGMTVENNSLHVMDNRSRIAVVRVGNALPGDGAPDKKVKYHLGDHLGSSNVLVDETGSWINREEYLPYGETSFGTFARKRYRFTGKERDAESGLYYHGARYYAPWLGKWTSADPAGAADGINVFWYTRDNPLRFSDPAGQMSKEEANRYVAQMKARGFRLPSEQPGSWAGVLTSTPSSLAIDCTKGEPFEKIMTAKGTIRDAQFVSTLALTMFGGFVAVEMVPLLAWPLGTWGSFQSGTSVTQAATGKHWLTGQQLDTRERAESGISGGIGFLMLGAGVAGRGGAKNVEVFGRGSATQAKIGGNLREFPLRAELAETARWVGKGATGKPASSNTLGFERGSLFSALHERFPNLFPAKGNPVVTPEIAEKFPEFEPYMGEKLIEHHIAHSDLTYPVPESIHKGSSTFLHGTARNVGPAADQAMGNVPSRPGDRL